MINTHQSTFIVTPAVELSLRKVSKPIKFNAFSVHAVIPHRGAVFTPLTAAYGIGSTGLISTNVSVCIASHPLHTPVPHMWIRASLYFIISIQRYSALLTRHGRCLYYTVTSIAEGTIGLGLVSIDVPATPEPLHTALFTISDGADTYFIPSMHAV